MRQNGFSAILAILLTLLVVILTVFGLNYYFVNTERADTRVSDTDKIPTQDLSDSNPTLSEGQSSNPPLVQPIVPKRPEDITNTRVFFNRPALQGSIATSEDGLNTYTSHDGAFSFSYPNSWEICSDVYADRVKLLPLQQVTDEYTDCDYVNMYSGVYVSSDIPYLDSKENLRASLQEKINNDIEYRENFIAVLRQYEDTEINNLVQDVTIQGLEGFLTYEFGVHGPVLKTYYLFSETEDALLIVQGALQLEEQGSLEVLETIAATAEF